MINEKKKKNFSKKKILKKIYFKIYKVNINIYIFIFKIFY